MSFSHSPQIKTDYRRDIDGLRALAIISVVAYHASPLNLPGGFVGVDIFFVISGFLISGIIFRALAEDRFSFIDFYSRRIRRIFPALILVLLATFVGGWFTLLADEFKQLGKHMAASAGFFENFLLWREAGYFDTASELKPLLHLWSLAIEEQYYLVYPIFIVALWRYRDKLLLVIGTAALASFLLNIGRIHTDPAGTFFLPQTRIWELLAGGLLAFQQLVATRPDRQPDPLLNNVLAGCGLLLLVAAIFIINKQFSFPGWWALLPVIGTILLLYAGQDAWINRRLLSHRWMVAMGLISYPLYLWHWPLLAFARILEGGIPSREIRMAAVLLSIVLAWLTYTFLENPIRRRAVSPVKTLVLLILMMIIGVAGYFAYLRNGFPARDNERNQFALYFESGYPEFKYIKNHKIDELYRQKCDFVGYHYEKVKDVLDPECYTAHTDQVVFLWGDSHAQHLYHGLRKSLPENISLLQVTTSACPPSIYQNETWLGCNKSNKFALDKIREIRPQVVIMAQLNGHETKNFIEIARNLKSLGVKKIFLIGPVVKWEPFLYKTIVNNYWIKTPKRLNAYLLDGVSNIDNELKIKYKNSLDLKYVSIRDYFCNSNGCITYFGDDRLSGITTWDYGHFTSVSSEKFADKVLAPLIIDSFGSQKNDDNRIK